METGYEMNIGLLESIANHAERIGGFYPNNETHRYYVRDERILSDLLVRLEKILNRCEKPDVPVIYLGDDGGSYTPARNSTDK